MVGQAVRAASASMLSPSGGDFRGALLETPGQKDRLNFLSAQIWAICCSGVV
jgi:hypothetical protein